jgi:hypothetical protein
MTYSQDSISNITEYYISVKSSQVKNAHSFLKSLSPSEKYPDSLFYASPQHITQLEKNNIDFNILLPPSKQGPVKMAKTLSVFSNNWASYPTYEQYVNIMHSFTDSFPDICSLIEMGESVKGRKLYMIHLSNNHNEIHDRPGVKISSTMHGDEAVTFVVTLRLINYLLNSYSTDHRITNMINSLNIYINPVLNPDGLYAGGNETIYGATRFNANSIDLNRNFPDPEDGAHPDGNTYQAETQAMINFLNAYPVHISTNIHAGAEVVNYPYDTWDKLHADDDWFKTISHNYADTAQSYSASGYFTSVTFPDGITNGYDWYSINGGQQDYATYFMRSREITLEISDYKIPAGSDLPQYWEANYRSLINFIEEAKSAITGKINSTEGDAIRAEIGIPGHDELNSSVFSDSITGNFYRYISPGIYTLKITAHSYHDTLIQIEYPGGSYSLEKIVLNQVKNPAEENHAPKIKIYPNPLSNTLWIKYEGDLKVRGICSLYSTQGQLIKKQAYKNEFPVKLDVSNLPPGIYYLKVEPKGSYERFFPIIKN